jgi:hypothetical protein
MKQGSKKLIALAAAGACVFGAYKLWSWSSDQETAGTKKLVNQVWIERVPADSRDMIGHLVVLKHPRGRFGAAGRSSQWRHLVEVFQWRLEGDRLTAFFPQDRVRTRVKVKTWRCEGEAPEPFELCLKLTAGDRSAMFYSRDEWEIRPRKLDASFDAIAADMPELAGTLESIELPAAEDSSEPTGSVESSELLDLLQ